MYITVFGGKRFDFCSALKYNYGFIILGKLGRGHKYIPFSQVIYWLGSYCDNITVCGSVKLI